MSKAEEYIKAYTRGNSNELVHGGYHEWLTPENALAAVELAREEMMKDAIEGYVARDKNMGLFLYKEEPILNKRFGGFWQGERSLCIPRRLFLEQKWDDRPLEVKIIIIKK